MKRVFVFAGVGVLFACLGGASLVWLGVNDGGPLPESLPHELLSAIQESVEKQFGFRCTNVGVRTQRHKQTFSLTCDAKVEPRLQGVQFEATASEVAPFIRGQLPLGTTVTHICVRATEAVKEGFFRAASTREKCVEVVPDAPDAGSGAQPP